jgi:sec-independent protein translocase protein TatA
MHAAFWGLGWGEILLLTLLVLLLFGASRLPALARGVRKAADELRGNAGDAERQPQDKA